MNRVGYVFGNGLVKGKLQLVVEDEQKKKKKFLVSTNNQLALARVGIHTSSIFWFFPL